MKKPIELPKQLHSWLFSLQKGLKKLKREDRDDILLSYVEQFNEQINEGLSVNQIQGQLRPISEIVQEIYAEFNLNSVIKIHDKKTKEVVKVKIQGDEEETGKKTSTRTLTVFSFLLSTGVWTLTIIFGAIAVLLPIVVIFAITMTYINYDPYYATSLAVIFLGALPFVDVLAFFLTKGLYRTSVKMVSPFKKKTPKKFGIKWWLFALLVGGICSALILGIGVGTTYKDGYLDNSINQKYQYQQELATFDTYQALANAIEDPTVTDKMLEDYFTNKLVPWESKFRVNTSRHYYQIVEKNAVDFQAFSLKIYRNYNLKENYKLDLQKIKIEAVFYQPGVIQRLELVLPGLDWFNDAVGWQPETLEFIYN